MFREFSRPSSGAQWLQWFYLRIVVTVVLCSCSGRLARTRTQHDYHHDMKVKPEAATAVTELLMRGGRTPETCWAVNKRQDNRLENCCIWLVIYLNCTVMHGLTNLKFCFFFFNFDNDNTNIFCSDVGRNSFRTYQHEDILNEIMRRNKIHFTFNTCSVLSLTILDKNKRNWTNAPQVPLVVTLF